MVMGAIAGGVGIANAVKGLFKKEKSASQAAREQYNYNLALQKDQQEYNTYAYQHRYQWEADDKAAAGINKLYGMNGASAPTSGLASVNQPDYVGERNAKQNMIVQGLQIGQQSSAIAADNELKYSQARTERVRTIGEMYETINRKLETLYRKKELDNYDKKLKSELEKQKAETSAAFASAIKNMADAGSAQALKKKTDEERKGIEEDNKRKRVVGKIMEKHPIVGGYMVGAEGSGISGGVAGGFSKILDTLDDQVEKGNWNKKSNYHGSHLRNRQIGNTIRRRRNGL